jgi:hypothetical protein
MNQPPPQPLHPRVLNKHHGGIPKDAVYIGRPSKWGNPFAIPRDGNRAEVIAKYRAWIANNTALMAALPELRGRDLVCFCAPAACHGDTLLELANGPSLDKALDAGRDLFDEPIQGGRRPITIRR